MSQSRSGLTPGTNAGVLRLFVLSCFTLCFPTPPNRAAGQESVSTRRQDENRIDRIQSVGNRAYAIRAHVVVANVEEPRVESECKGRKQDLQVLAFASTAVVVVQPRESEKVRLITSAGESKETPAPAPNPDELSVTTTVLPESAAGSTVVVEDKKEKRRRDLTAVILVPHGRIYEDQLIVDIATSGGTPNTATFRVRSTNGKPVEVAIVDASGAACYVQVTFQGGAEKKETRPDQSVWKSPAHADLTASFPFDFTASVAGDWISAGSELESPWPAIGLGARWWITNELALSLDYELAFLRADFRQATTVVQGGGTRGGGTTITVVDTSRVSLISNRFALDAEWVAWSDDTLALSARASVGYVFFSKSDDFGDPQNGVDARLGARFYFAGGGKIHPFFELDGGYLQREGVYGALGFGIGF